MTSKQTKEVITDRGVCKFHILGRCRHGDECRWEHSDKQCQGEECDVYIRQNHKMCYKCNQEEKKKKNDEMIRALGYPCVNNVNRHTGKKGPCENYTMRGDYCHECFEEAMEYVVTACKGEGCNNRVYGRRGYCDRCEMKNSL